MQIDAIRDVLSEVSEFYGFGYNTEFSELLELMKISRLDRIADTLESIDGELDSISVGINSLVDALNGCISKTRQGDALCVTGHIMTKEI